MTTHVTVAMRRDSLIMIDQRLRFCSEDGGLAAGEEGGQMLRRQEGKPVLKSNRTINASEVM